MRTLLIHAEAWVQHFWFRFRWSTSESFRRHVDETFRAEEERRFAEGEQEG